MKIAVASGKGGTGKTLVSTNLFAALEKEGMPVALVDCDAEEPNVGEFITGEVFREIHVSQMVPVVDPEKCVFCGKCSEYCNYNAIICLPHSKFIQVVEDLCHDCGACIEACEIDAIWEKEKHLGLLRSMITKKQSKIVGACSDVGVYSPVPVIRKAIKETEANLLTILDAPPGVSCPFIATVDDADFVVLVTEPTPFGLNDLKLSVETLRQLGRQFGVVVNRAGLGNDEVYQWIGQNHIPLLMEIPFDREVARIYSEGKLLVDEMPDYQVMFTGLMESIKAIVKP